MIKEYGGHIYICHLNLISFKLEWQSIKDLSILICCFKPDVMSSKRQIWLLCHSSCYILTRFFPLFLRFYIRLNRELSMRCFSTAPNLTELNNKTSTLRQKLTNKVRTIRSEWNEIIICITETRRRINKK